MTNQTKIRKLSTRFINQYDAIGYDLWEISKDLEKILRREKNKVSETLKEAANLIAEALNELEKNKNLQNLINKSKSKSATNILYKMQFMEDELKAYIKVFDK